MLKSYRKYINTIKTTKLIYIASPYTGLTKWTVLNKFIQLCRFRKITSVIGRLQDKYKYAFIGPITQSHQTQKYMAKRGTKWCDWKLVDVTYLEWCDEIWVVMMPGWDESVGVLDEIKHAKEFGGIKIRYLDPETLRFKTIKG